MPGMGVLLSTLRGPKYQSTDDLYSVLEHGDIKMSLDFMIPNGSIQDFTFKVVTKFRFMILG